MKNALFLGLLFGSVLSQGAIAGSLETDEPCPALAATEADDALSPEAAWLVLDGCVDDPRLDPGAESDFQQIWPRMQQCSEAVRTIVQAGTDADRERLWSVFDRLEDGSRIAEDVIDAFLDWHVERALSALEESPAPAANEPAVADVQLPDFLGHAPVDLQQAWRTYQTVTQMGQHAREERPAGDAISYQSNEPAFRGTVAGFLRGRVSAAEAVRELSRYEWGGWCGNGSGLLYGPQSKALLIAHLEGHRPDLALAASGGLGVRMLGAEEQPARWDRRLLAASGIDWERFSLGGILSGETDLANDLARHGSDRAARQLLAVARLVGAAATEEAATDQEGNPDPESLLWSLAALVEPSGACTSYGTSSSRDVERDPEAGPVGREVQEDALDLLAANVRPGAGLSEAETAAHLLVRLCRPESRAAFRAMLQSPYDDVRTKGALGLRALGETVADPRASPPVAFRILVDGKPAALRKVQWSLETAEGHDLMSSADSDRDGIVRLKRDPFVDPQHPITSMRLASPDLASADDLWFDAGTAPPRDLAAVSTVSVRTGSLTVIVPEALLTGTGRRQPTLTLLAEGGRHGLDDVPLPMSEDLRITSTRTTFAHLQHGRYQVWLQRGGDIHTSSIVEVGPRPATTTVSERSMAEDLVERIPAQ